MEKDENSKIRILKSAIKLFSQKGFASTSVREICKDAGVNICMISYYWGGKKELYQDIMDRLNNRQYEFLTSFCDVTKSPYDMTNEEKISLLYLWLDKFINLYYSDVISQDIISLLLREQQNPNLKSTILEYFHSVVGSIIGKQPNDRETVFKSLFIISQINSPRILTSMSLAQLGEDTFSQTDIKIIKENINMYVANMIKEAGIG